MSGEEFHIFFFFFQAEDGIRALTVTGVQTCALPICSSRGPFWHQPSGEPVGWCQYGPREELPRIDNQRIYQGLAPQGSERLWRITCFAVLKPYRKRGVASAALRAALESIRRQGGGLVEAYPITRWLSRAFGNESTHGTESMFQKSGFKVVAPFGSTRYSSRVLMRRTI